MNCPSCNGKPDLIRTDSPWEFDIWCRRCEKRIGTQSWNHADPPPENIEAYEEPTMEIQGSLF